MVNKGREKPSDRRAGNRKDRNQRVGKRVPELGYYLIVTDTDETEKNYFEGLRNSIPEELKDRLVIKVEKAKTVELVKRAMELASKEPQYRIPWIVFDRDQVKGFDEIIQEAERNGVGAGWSNPCFEIWMYAYFFGEAELKPLPLLFIDRLKRLTPPILSCNLNNRMIKTCLKEVLVWADY